MLEKSKFTKIDEEFICENCGKKVPKLGYTCRNHCPYCLHSKHLDINPGDRAEECHGILEPIGLETNSKKGYIIVFKCKKCGAIRKNKMAEDDDMDETTVKLANDNFTEVAKIILEGVGGKGNVASIDNCITRLRLEIKDYTAVDEKKIKSAGVAGVIRPGKNSVQVVIGTKVQFVADEFKKLCK